MGTKTIKKDGYNLHLIKNTNFKTILVKIVFWNKIKEDEITFRNVLFNNLLFSSSKYKTTREMAIKKTDLYGLNIISNTSRMSNYICNELFMSIIEDKYTEKGLFKESLEFLFDILKNPNVKDNSFDKECFDINKTMIEANIKKELEDPTSFAFKNYQKLLDKSKPYSYSLVGTIKDLNKITPKNLYEYYKEFFKNNNIDIMVIGNIDFSIVEELFNNLSLKGKNNYDNDIYITYEKDFEEKTISSKFNQSKLIMGGSTKDLTIFEKKYVSSFYNIILGASPTSKLFQNVREKNSFAYTVGSNFIRLDGLFFIYAGISKKNYNKTKEEVLKQMEEMKKGKFTKKEIDNARTYIKTILEEAEDYEYAIIDRYFNNLYFDIDSKEEQLKNIDKVTKEDIIKLANKIKIDTILLIEEKK